MDGQQRQNRERGDERLGRGHADFRAGVHVDAAVGFAGDGAADDVDDGQRAVAAALGFAQRGERVGGLAGLREDEQHGVPFERRVAVTEFVRELDLHRHLREFLDQVFADQRRVPARAAGGDDDAVDRAQFGGRHVQAAETGGGALVVDAAAQGIFHGARLLENFLEHEVLVLAALGVLLANSSLLIWTLAVSAPRFCTSKWSAVMVATS